MLVFLAGAVFVPARLTDAVKWVATNDFAHQLRALSEPETVQKHALIEIVVESLGISQIDLQPVVILKQKDGNVLLPIWIGAAEANAISVVLKREGVRRPLTPDLLCSIIDRVEASVAYVVIDDLQDNTFYAKVIVKANWAQMELDARPSDAIAIALRVRAPIYVAKTVLDKAGIQSDQKPEEKQIG